MSKIKVAVVGGSGLVGAKILQVLKERNIVVHSDTDTDRMRVMIKKQSDTTTNEVCARMQNNIYANKMYIGAEIFLFNSKHPPTNELVGKMKFDYALMAVSAELASKYTPLFVKYGATVIDNSSYYRMHKNVPLVVPEINFDDIGNSKIIANPNCSTIGCIVPLSPLDKVYKIKRLVYSTYQAVSGAGAAPQFLYPIDGNLFPHIDKILTDGNTKEEEKMINETKKILHRPDIAVSATCVRVPVANCHCVSINCEFEKKPSVAKIKKILAKSNGAVLCDMPMPVIADGRDEVFVGRIRLDKDNKNTINLWTCSDNVRKGAATNAVQILEMLIQKSLFTKRIRVKSTSLNADNRIQTRCLPSITVQKIGGRNA